MRCPECGDKMVMLKKYAACDSCGYTVKLIQTNVNANIKYAPHTTKHATFEKFNFSPSISKTINKNIVDKRVSEKEAKFKYKLYEMIVILIFGIIFFILHKK